MILSYNLSYCILSIYYITVHFCIFFRRYFLSCFWTLPERSTTDNNNQVPNNLKSNGKHFKLHNLQNKITAINIIIIFCISKFWLKKSSGGRLCAPPPMLISFVPFHPFCNINTIFFFTRLSLKLYYRYGCKYAFYLHIYFTYLYLLKMINLNSWLYYRQLCP